MRLKAVDEFRVFQHEHPIFYQEEPEGTVTEVPIDYELESMIDGGIKGLATQLYSDGVIDKTLYQGYKFKTI